MQEYRFAFFNFKQWVAETEQTTNLKFTASLIDVLGKAKAEFFLCKSSNIRMCTHPALFKN